MADPRVLEIATEAEKVAYRWVRKRGFDEPSDFVFFPLLLGGISLGYISVNFYFRPGTALDSPLGWRIRPAPYGNEKETEKRLVTIQQQSSTSVIVLIDDLLVLRRRLPAPASRPGDIGLHLERCEFLRISLPPVLYEIPNLMRHRILPDFARRETPAHPPTVAARD